VIAFLALLAPTLLLAGCASVRVSTDYDRTFDFTAYRTFSWDPASAKDRSGPDAPPTLVQRRIRGAADDELLAKGYVRTNPAAADFLLAYHGGVRHKVDVTRTRYGRHGRWTAVRVDPYQEGTLVLDIIDGPTHELVWRGVGIAVVGKSRTPDADIRKAVTAILEKFPPT